VLVATYGGQVASESSAGDTPADDPFAAELAANSAYAHEFALGGLEPVAARGLAVVTCMDSRIEPLQMLGLRPGDAKILRNAGARVTGDVLRTLVLAVHLLGVRRVLVVPHTGCRMSAEDEGEVHAAIFAAAGVDTRSLELRPAPDAVAALRQDIQRIRSSPYLPRDLAVGGAIYDVDSGRLSREV
jgi:carbonic anhydrase